MNEPTKNDASYSSSHIDNEKNSLAERIKECMGDKSVSAFARECGMNESTLRYILSGSFPRTDHLTAIANASGVTIDWLATGRGIKYIRDLKHAEENLRSAPQAVLPELPPELEPYKKRLDALLIYLSMIEDDNERSQIIDDFVLRAQDKIDLSPLKDIFLKKNANNNKK